MSDTFDLVVIGGGPGGYVAAIRAAQLGLKTACIDKRPTLGGTCLNVGCIPSKALLQSSHQLETAQHAMAAHGVEIKGVKANLTTMMQRKQEVVQGLTQGIAFLFKKNKVTHLMGSGTIVDSSHVQVTAADGSVQTLTTENILIASGSEVATLPGLEIDEKHIISSTGALALDKVPKKMVVIGAGVIGLELGSVWRRLGAEVTVVEFLDGILPGMDGEIRKTAQRTLSKQGMHFKLGTKVTAASVLKNGVKLTMEPVKGGEAEERQADVVLVAVGRRPYTQGLGLENIGVTLDERGFIPVDHDRQTTCAGVFAIGDVIGGAMLAHKAEEEGSAVAEALAGQVAHVNYDAIPAVVYTHPEIASVGQSEESLTAAGIPYKVGKFPFMANSRARAIGDAEGFVKILAHATSDAILGAHIIGPAAGDLIAEIVLAMECDISAEDIARTCHAHPGLGEAVKEAALAVDKRAIHA
ncbi:dihydrolipoamide dehydrogenase [Magnetococcus marinus MC-1]|uniref:Dihydrolipoyl dehydrogenase n=1 Tax=Magnetococcus marinus (strain ATCC BAA-1437 / JCM 17883 / MC-1) TaxID=156889 RepID=A0LAA4_MAGMM|nr:dihydrolipoyl dehydrogenase [Magnetococcus marinus]ABK44897.1 dihydrolipoamide dehydrogenase [Magnetococcus marinus MC-1]